LGDETDKNDMGGACSTYGGEEVHTGVWWENLRIGTGGLLM